ncbi:MAG TPA: MarR family transcriptional regulator [Arachnia sp.]|nr:MarR family transcriptional regulator [Arachnia sp.]HQD21086.1 MarR family transcriptional regulator [Arachnia sp.]
MSDAARPDLSPILTEDPLDMRLTLASIIHWADSREVREGVMAKVRFPADDVQMFLVVNQLAYRGALRPTDLSSVLGTGKANITKIVGRLEEIGLALRIPSDRDERSVLVALTPLGREMGQRIMAVAGESFSAALDGWSGEDVETLRRLLGRFARQAMRELAYRASI